MQKIGLIKVSVSSVLNSEIITWRLNNFCTILFICQKKIDIFGFWIKIYINDYVFINIIRIPQNGKDQSISITKGIVTNSINSQKL